MGEDAVKDLRGQFAKSFHPGEKNRNTSFRRLTKLPTFGTYTSQKFNRSKFGFSTSLEKVDRNPKQLRVLVCTSNLGNAEPSKESMAAWIPEKGDMDSVIYESQFDIGFDHVGDEHTCSQFHENQRKRYGHFDIIVIGMQEATFSCDNSNRSLHRGDDSANGNGGQREPVRQGSVGSASETDMNYFGDSVRDVAFGFIDPEEEKEQKEELKEELDKELYEDLHEDLHEEIAQRNDQKLEVEFAEDIGEVLGKMDINEPKLNEVNSTESEEIMSSTKAIRFSDTVDEVSIDNIIFPIFENEPEQKTKEIKRNSIFRGTMFRRSSSRVKSLRSSLLKRKQHSRALVKKPIDVTFVDVSEKKKALPEPKLIKEEHFVSSRWEKSPLLKKTSVRNFVKRSSISSLINSVSLAVRSSTASENCVSMKGGKFEFNSRFKKKDTIVLNELIAERCPNHDFVVNYLHGAIRLVILVKKKLVKELQDVSCKAVSTGIASVLRNKGGIIASMTIRETRLAFISAHLAAHEGKQHYNQRNQNIASILNSGKVGKYDASLANHHCFLLGDLNYRLDYSPVNDEKMHVVKKAVELIKAKEWHDLNEMDELHVGLRNQEVLVGFKTPLCLFPPTFKVERARGYHYLSQRSPSYTDRILWRSSQGLDSCVTPLVYEPIESYTNSDHKPIRCAFHIDTHTAQINIFARFSRFSEIKSVFNCFRKRVNSQRRRRSSSMRGSLFGSFTGSHGIQDICIDVSGMKFYPEDESNILWNSTKKKSVSSYYVMFDSEPTVLRSRKPCNSKYSYISSVSRPQSLCCITKRIPCVSWRKEKVELRIDNNASLTGAILYINIMSKMMIRENDLLIGTVVLNLETLCKFSTKSFNGRNFVVDEPLLKNGQEQGNLTCDIKVFDAFQDLVQPEEIG